MIHGFGNEGLLKRDLIARYEQFPQPLLPRNDSSQPVSVKVGFALIRILDFNEDTGNIHILGWGRYVRLVIIFNVVS